MKDKKYPINSHQHYHAHIYFDKSTLALATQLCEGVGEIFDVTVGQVHQKLVGPHTKWNCQILFERHQFDEILAWLDKNRGDLSVLIHAVTGNDLEDHTANVYWLGERVNIDVSIFN